MAELKRLLFVGGGINSAVGDAHFIAAQMDKRFVVAGGTFSRDQTLSLATADKWCVPSQRVFSDYREMLKQNIEADAVVVLTPTPTHKEVVIAAIAAGYDVICEKALATSAQQAVEIAQAVSLAARKCFVTFNYTGYPALRELKQVIASGALGEIQQVLIEMPQDSYARKSADGQTAQPQSWRQRDYDLPTVHLDLGVHVQNICSFLVGGSPAAIQALESSYGAVPGVVDTCHATIQLDNGVVTTWWYTKAALGYRNGLRVRVLGSEASADWVQSNPEVLHVARANGVNEIRERGCLNAVELNKPRYQRFKAGHPSGFIEAFANYYCDVSDALSGDSCSGDWVYSADDASVGLQVMADLHNSAVGQ